MTIYVGSNSYASLPNVIDYGADPSGVADSTTAFTNCGSANNVIYAPAGTYKIASTFECAGKSLRGDGPQATVLQKNSATGSMVTITPGGGTTLTEIADLAISFITTAPTSGSAIYMSSNGAGARIHHVAINGAYNGVELTASNGSWSDLVALSDIRIYNAINSGLYAHDNPNPISLTDFVIWMLNNATGYGIHLQNQIAGFVAANGETVFGQYSLFSEASSNTTGNRPEFCQFSDVFFDSASGDASGTGHGGVYLTAMAGGRFKGCWAATYNTLVHTGSGVYLASGVEDVGFSDCYFIENPRHGAYVEAGTKHIRFMGCSANGNSLATANTYDGIHIAANATDFSIIGCTATSSSSIIGGTPAGGSQNYGINVATGTSDRYHIKDNLVAGNNTAGVNDGGSGANKEVANNY